VVTIYYHYVKYNIFQENVIYPFPRRMSIKGLVPCQLGRHIGYRIQSSTDCVSCDIAFKCAKHHTIRRGRSLYGRWNDYFLKISENIMMHHFKEQPCRVGKSEALSTEIQYSLKEYSISLSTIPPQSIWVIPFLTYRSKYNFAIIMPEHLFKMDAFP